MKRLVLVRYVWQSDAIDEDWCMEFWTWKVWRTEPLTWRDVKELPRVRLKVAEARIIWQAIYGEK